MLLRTLGGLSLEGSTLKRPKPLLLLSYLALEGTRDRKHLSELFWPTAASPMHNLRTALTQLRQHAPDVLEGDEQLSARVTCDARELLETLERGELEKLQEVYRGPFLKGFYLEELGVELEEWIYATREFIAAQVRTGLLRLAETKAAEGRFTEAAKIAEEAYTLAGAGELEPEDFARVYLLLLSGDSPRAREVKREAEGFELKLDFTSEEAKAQLFREPQTRPLAVASNLPSRPTSFIGRDLELVEIANLLRQEDCRLITLLGAGGVGKTRLALRVAQEALQQENFPDGVFFVGLEALADPELVPATIASSLGVTLQGRAEPLAGLLAFLKDKHMLLVLDNFEQLVYAAGLVSEMLQGCPKLKLLITSRERLGLAEEWLFAVEGFPVPDTPEEAEHVDAVKLFMQRAKRIRLDFSLKENLPHILNICRFVDGSPLGIELAAAWVRMMPPEDIAAEIAQSLDLLESSERNVSKRHQSLRATFEHSWRLLRPKEQEVLRKLSVFIGGFTREAASKVAGASIPVLGSLADKSLLRLLPSGRYDRHPLLYQYSREKLAEHREEQLETQMKHASYFLDFVEMVTAKLWEEPGQDRWLARLHAERDNLRAAFNFLVAQGQIEEAGRLAAALIRFWQFQGNPQEGHRWYETVLAADRLSVPVRAKVLVGAGWLSVMLSDLERARTLIEEGYPLLQGPNDLPYIGYALAGLGFTKLYQGDLGKASSYMEESLQRARTSGKPWLIAAALNCKAAVAMRQGEYLRATEYLEESLALLRKLDATDTVPATLLRLGQLALYQGDDERAFRLFAEGLPLGHELGLGVGVAGCLEGVAVVAARRGRARQAALLFGAATAMRGVVGEHHSGLGPAIYEECRNTARTQLGDAAYQAAWAQGRALPLAQAIAYALSPEELNEA